MLVLVDICASLYDISQYSKRAPRLNTRLLANKQLVECTVGYADNGKVMRVC